ncbi:hypothetical protein ACJ0RR_004499 [Serratia liquefaciens]|uniref:hypothetical protein n=1 Tax=Serratia liquefaciens TaxID=614 RepID=UPI0039063BA3
MMTRKSIDTVLFSVAADKLSQREWDWIKLMKSMDPPPEMVVSAILEHRHDTAALAKLLLAKVKETLKVETPKTANKKSSRNRDVDGPEMA